MKKLLLFAAMCLLAMASCETKTIEQRAAESLAKKKAALEQEQMARERYIDSLVNVAAGYEGVTLRTNRQHALDILRKEYPTLQEKWDAVQESIDNMERY